MEINKKIESLISENDVCLFMKGTPDAPHIVWIFNGRF